MTAEIDGVSAGDDLPPDELAGLRQSLQRQRDLVAWKLRDIDAATLQAVTTPSGMTALGIVRHLGEVELSWWFDDVLGDLERGPHPGRPDTVPAGSTTGSVLAAYAAACAVCDEAIRGLELDAPGIGTPSVNVRWVYLHLIEETARHLGQLDLLRELADGATGEDPFP